MTVHNSLRAAMEDLDPDNALLCSAKIADGKLLISMGGIYREFLDLKTIKGLDLKELERQLQSLTTLVSRRRRREPAMVPRLEALDELQDCEILAPAHKSRMPLSGFISSNNVASWRRHVDGHVARTGREENKHR